MLLGLVEQAVALLLRLIGVAQAIQFVVNILNGPADNATPGSSLAVINARTTLIEQDIESPLFGLAHIEATIVSNQTALLAAIALCQQTGHPVTFPTSPPAGYGAAETASDVWATPIVLASGNVAADVLAWAGIPALLRGGVEDYLRSGVTVGWMVSGEWNNIQLSPDLSLGTIDPTTILATDASPTAWADRVYTSFAPYSTDAWKRPYFDDGRLGAGWRYTIDMDELQFSKWQALLFPAQPSSIPPVWPGVANVTLGASQVLADGLLIPGPLDGVIIAITAVPSPISYYPFGPIKSFVHVGGIAFVDDNGQVETVQPIGLDQNVVCPKSMIQADHAYLRLQNGVTGTVRPWLKT